MAWHSRCGTRSYYRSRRIGNTVRRILVGRGTVGEVAEQLDRSLREERLRHAAMQREQTQALHRLLDAHRVTDAALLVQIRGYLLAAGFYQHHRSEWRRRTMTLSIASPSETLRFPTTPANPAEWRQLVDRANTGDTAALGLVRHAFEQQPALVAAAADLEQTCRTLALDLVSSADHVLREALQVKLQALEAKFAGASESPAMQAAAKRVALAWLVLQVADLHVVEQMKSSTVPKRWLYVQEACERRYAAALKLVETLRGLTQRPAGR